MHAEKFLHKLLGKAIHIKRIKILAQIIVVVVNLKQLKLTSIGRGFDLGNTERSGIQKMDRFLRTRYYQTQSIDIYREIVRLTVGSKKRIEIIVDWTKLPNCNEYGLRAALAAEGRAITLYEEVHPKKKEGNAEVHKQFLKKLKSILPIDCKPIVLTDAGFKNPWFKAVIEIGWDYIGRIRGRVSFSKDRKEYKACSELHRKATAVPTALGQMILAQRAALKTHFYLVKKKLQGRKKRLSNGKVSQHKDAKDYGRSHREPWLLVSSLKGYFAAKKVVAIYKRRMTIEEAFRDLKSEQYGFSLEENITLKRERLIVWLMVAALASLWAWIMGQAAEQAKLHYQFQANTVRHRRVLSFFYLGCQIIRKKITLLINWTEIQFTQPEYGG